jgi:hypothetical protein
MTSTVGFHTGYNPQTKKPESLHLIQERFGSQLEAMTYEQKIVFRAALAGFIAEKPVWQEEGSSITCIDCCIESSGADWSIWDEDGELVGYIQACSQLNEADIEGLIEVLSAQIRGKIYSSRSV